MGIVFLLIEHIGRKTLLKINAFSRLNTYISRADIITLHVVLLSNFNYCPLILLFCNKGANKEINRTHKRVLRMLYEDYECPLEILLTRSGGVCIHAKNLLKTNDRDVQVNKSS